MFNKEIFETKRRNSAQTMYRIPQEIKIRGRDEVINLLLQNLIFSSKSSINHIIRFKYIKESIKQRLTYKLKATFHSTKVGALGMGEGFSIIQSYNNSINKYSYPVAYNSMGISISHSDADNEVKRVKEYKKQKRLEMIGSEVQKATSNRYDLSALKQNYQQTKSANVSPHRTNTKNSILNDQAANNIFSLAQKKLKNISSKTAEQAAIPTPKSGTSVTHQQQVSEQRLPENPKSGHQKVPKQIQQASAISAKKTNLMKQDLYIPKEMIDQSTLREVQAVSVKRSQNIKSWREPLPKQPLPSQKDAFNVEMRRVSFGQYDWNIPGEEQQKDVFRRKGIMPSMNLVLSNKFAQNTSNLGEEQQNSAAKSRRQVMRELLSGKRNTGDDDFKIMPNCNFQNLEVSRICQNR